MTKYHFLILIIIGCLSCKNTYHLKENGQPSLFKYSELKVRTVKLVDGSITRSEKASLINDSLTTAENQYFWELIGNSSLDFVIVFYLHGIEECGGNWTKRQYNLRMKEIMRNVEDYGNFSIKHFYYQDEELERYMKVADYIEDKNESLNKLIFDGHTYCSSFAVVRNDGRMVGCLGESMIVQNVTESVLFLMNSNMPNK